MPRILGYNVTSTEVLKGPITLLDNQASPQSIASFDMGSVNFVQWQLSLSRGGNTFTGTLLMTADGVQAASQVDGVWSLQDLGITFSTSVSGSSVIIQYVSTATGSNAVLKYYEKSWI